MYEPDAETSQSNTQFHNINFSRLTAVTTVSMIVPQTDKGVAVSLF